MATTTTPTQALFSPIRLGQVEVRNRFAASGMGWSWAGMGLGANLPGHAVAEFWRARAVGGVGLIISEPQSVHPTSTPSPLVIENTSDVVLAPYRGITEAVHGAGGTIFAQLAHLGHLGGGGHRNLPLWAPSAVRAPMGTLFPQGGGVLPHEMDRQEIAEVVEAFASAAARCMEAGFDGVEVNAAEGYLVAQFLSPLINRRADEYGGALGQRLRLLLEVVAAVRERAGRHAAVGVRLGTEDHLEGGLTVADVQVIAQALGQGGLVDYLATIPGVLPPMGAAPGAHADLAQAVKASSGLPVLYHGWVDGPATATSLIEAGACDLVGMSRGLLADPYLPLKVQRGAEDEIRPCIGCQGCLLAGMSCTVNASTADPTEPARAEIAKRILVIGGGPGGCEAAAQLAHVGHSVTLWERGAAVGGALLTAARAPSRARLRALVAFHERALAREGVHVEIGREATVDDIRDFAPDLVVVATGAVSHQPPVAQSAGSWVHDARSVLAGEAELGSSVLVVMGRADHRFQGLTAAEFAAAAGRQVEVVTDAHFPGDLWEATSRLSMYRRLAGLGVRFTPMLELVGLREGDVELRNVYSHEVVRRRAESVVVSYGDDASAGLLDELEVAGIPAVAIGDAVAPRGIDSAVREAAALPAVLKRGAQ